MDRQNLEASLLAEGISADAYDLTGNGKSEAYVLRQEPSGWSVFYRERGLETGTVTFAAEGDACAHLLSLLRADPTTS